MHGPSDGAADEGLTDAVIAFAGGEVSAEEFTERFMASRWYALRSERPGFLAVGSPGSGHVPIFSSLAELATYAATFPDQYADGIDWLSTIGDDLLTLMPEGYGLVVDVASEHAVHLAADAIKRRPVLLVRSRSANGGDGRSGA